MAAGRSQCADGPVLRRGHLLLLVLLGSSVLTCCMSAAPPPAGLEGAVQYAVDVEEAVAAAPAHATPFENPQNDRNASTFSEGNAPKSDKEDRENFALLRTAVAAADATETEKPTDSRYFLGVVSQRIRRHLLVDIVSLVALLAGYYLVATGLTQKAAQKPTNRTNKQAP